MISKDIAKAVNAQIAHEQANSHAYRAVACYFRRLNLHGFTAFFKKQSGEETGHAERLLAHLEERGGTVELQVIPAPKNEWSSPVEAIKAVRDMEKNTSKQITALYELALAKNDHALAVSVQWLVNEQVEEEAWSEELVALAEQLGDSPAHLFILDHKWGKKAGEADKD
ncbi:MAG: ferritin [Tepidisphaeraceae bacterium]|jgi:ferritin